jgi:hypothetical protein
MTDPLKTAHEEVEMRVQRHVRGVNTDDVGPQAISFSDNPDRFFQVIWKTCIAISDNPDRVFQVI